EAGLPTAQAALADMLLKGEAGPPDLAAALPLLAAAAAGHHPVAQFELGELYETGAPPLLPKDLEVARRLYSDAAGHGMKEAADRRGAGGRPPPPPQAQEPPAPAPPRSKGGAPRHALISRRVTAGNPPPPPPGR